MHLYLDNIRYWWRWSGGLYLQQWTLCKQESAEVDRACRLEDGAGIQRGQQLLGGVTDLAGLAGATGSKRWRYSTLQRAEGGPWSNLHRYGLDGWPHANAVVSILFNSRGL